MASAMQELYDALFAYCQGFKGFGVHDVLPDMDASYPFVVLDSTQKVVDAYKIGSVPHEIVTLQVFAKREQRKELNEFIDTITGLRGVTTSNFDYQARLDENTVIMQTEDVDNDQLLHATIGLHFVAYAGNNQSTSYFKTL